MDSAYPEIPDIPQDPLFEPPGVTAGQPPQEPAADGLVYGAALPPAVPGDAPSGHGVVIDLNAR